MATCRFPGTSLRVHAPLPSPRRLRRDQPLSQERSTVGLSPILHHPTTPSTITSHLELHLTSTYSNTVLHITDYILHITMCTHSSTRPHIHSHPLIYPSHTRSSMLIPKPSLDPPPPSDLHSEGQRGAEVRCLNASIVNYNIRYTLYRT